MNIFAYNPEVQDLEKTFLSRPTAAGETVFRTKNTDRFDVGQKVLVGQMSRERSEILTVQSKTAAQLTLDAAEFPHDADDPIYALQYDQIRIYRSTTGESGVYNLLATVDVDVDNENGKTVYKDEVALDSYWYRVAQYDSVNDEETERSAAIQATGYPENSVGRTILDAVGKVGDKQFELFTIEDLLSIMNDINSDLITQARRPYRFLRTMEQLDVEADADSTDFPEDLWKIDFIEVNSELPTGTNTFQPRVVSASDMRYRRSLTPLAGNDVKEIAYDDFRSKLLFNPAALTDRLNAFNMHYYKSFDPITSMSQMLETPNNLIYKLGIWREWYLRKADDDTKYMTKAADYDKRYNAEVMKLGREKPLDVSSPSGFGPDRKRYAQWGGRRYRQ